MHFLQGAICHPFLLILKIVLQLLTLLLQAVSNHSLTDPNVAQILNFEISLRLVKACGTHRNHAKSAAQLERNFRKYQFIRYNSSMLFGDLLICTFN